MDIIGALKKSGSEKTVYFCVYHSEDFEWADVVNLLYNCRLMDDLSEENVLCIAVESTDKLQEDKTLVGISFVRGNDYVCLVNPAVSEAYHSSGEYSDIDFYLKEMAGDLTNDARTN